MKLGSVSYVSVRIIRSWVPIAIAGVAVVLLGLALASVSDPIRARASVCSGDSPAFSMNWRDNYWVGSDNDGSPICDQAGQFMVTVQRINWAHGYRASGVDGYYGSNTQDDVEDFQSNHGLSADGLVGTNTWGAYDNHPELVACYGTGECDWNYPAYASGAVLWHRKSSTSNICSLKLGGGSFVWFDRTGPSGTASC